MRELVNLEHLKDEVELLGHFGGGRFVETLDGLRGEDHKGGVGYGFHRDLN